MAQARKKPDPEPVPTALVFEWDGFRFSELDFTVGDCERLEQMTGVTFRGYDAQKSALLGRCWLTVAYEAKGIDEGEAKAKALPMIALIKGWKVEPIDLPVVGEAGEDGVAPLAEGPTGTE